MAQSRYFLTTTDNPFDPVDEQESWRLFDRLHGYDCERKVAREARTSDELSDSINQQEIRRAIAKVIAREPLTVYKMVEKPMPNYETE